MLSNTYSVQDVKNKLSSYTDYGYASDVEFTSAIILSLEDAQYMYMFPVIGTTYYAEIEDKDKVFTEDIEPYIYWAEVYYAAYEFIRIADIMNDASTSTGASEKLTVEGYTYETSDSSGSSSAISRKTFLDKAIAYLSLAGHNHYALKRSGSIFNAYN